MRLIIGLGSNLGNPIENLKKAVKYLKKEFKVHKISSCYKSQSLLKDEQPDYYNAIVLIDTEKDIYEIFNIIKKIENLMGKEKKFFWGPRLIDIDIIDWGGKIVETKSLTIPHKEMHNRSFVLYPLKEVLDNYIHPIYNKSVDEMIVSLEENYGIEKIGGKLCQ